MPRSSKSSTPSKSSAKLRSASTALPLHRDWEEFLSLLISNRVRFLIVGGHAVSLHAAPRMTEDLDIWIDITAVNVRKVRKVIADFGFGVAAPNEETLSEPYRVFMIGAKPFRIDVLNTLSGGSFRQAWGRRIKIKTELGMLPVIGVDDLIKNKRQAGRPKDLADVDALLRHRSHRRAEK